MLYRDLESIGLSKKEAKIYLALLGLGSSSVQDISNKSRVDRTTSYHILNSLIDKGLVSTFKKEGKSFFVPEPPEQLINFIDFKQYRLEESKNFIRKLLPQLETSYKTFQQKPSVRFYEGIEGLKSIYEDTLKQKPGGEILTWSSADDILGLLPDYVLNYIKRRARKRIKAKSIMPVPKTPLAKEVLGQSKQYMRELVLVPPEKFNLNTEINIYNNKVSIVSLKEEIIGVVIESKKITESLRAIFNLSWIAAQAMKQKLPKSGNSSEKKLR